MSSAKKAPKIGNLEQHATAIRADLHVPKQNEVFRAATEAGYLAALADGDLDETEREAIVKAIETLSVGAIIEWEAESFLEECEAHFKKDGAAVRCETIGAELKQLEQPEAGILFASFVAQATGGIEEREADVLHAIGKAAGLGKARVNAILKKVGADNPGMPS